VTVLDYPEFTGPRVVLPDGTVTLPVVGSVNASGKTTEQLAQELNSRLQPFLVNPVTTVSLNTLRPVSVTVSGEVLRPGPVQLRSLTDNSNQDTPETMPTVSLAVIQAGGITQYADLRSVTLTRRTPEGDSQQMTLNLWEAIGSPNPPPDLTLQDGDAIYIPRLAQGDTLDRRLASRSSYAPATVRVRVVGEVNAPGEVQVPPNSSISSAVAIAGGPTEDARLREVAFVRLDESGEISRETIDLRNLTDSYQVQEGDVVIVPKRGSSSLIDLAGRVLSPLNVLLNLFD
jgi:polysaccharide export outer membrane protein